jgi:hypothetical protein
MGYYSGVQRLRKYKKAIRIMTGMKHRETGRPVYKKLNI